LLLKRRRWTAFTNICSLNAEATMDVSTVWQWVWQIEEAQTGGAKLHDKLQIRCICTAVMPHICQVDELISSDHQITTDKLCSTLSPGKGSVMAIIQEISYFKLCDPLVPWMLTDAYKETRRATDTWVRASVTDYYREWNLSSPFCN
jgi:hypothetical protein